MNAHARALWQVWRSGDGREGPGVKRAATAATTRCTHIHRRGREGPDVKRAPGGVARALLLDRCCGC
jgi:plasmid replication initiation protein